MMLPSWSLSGRLVPDGIIRQGCYKGSLHPYFRVHFNRTDARNLIISRFHCCLLNEFRQLPRCVSYRRDLIPNQLQRNRHKFGNRTTSGHRCLDFDLRSRPRSPPYCQLSHQITPLCSSANQSKIESQHQNNITAEEREWSNPGADSQEGIPGVRSWWWKSGLSDRSKMKNNRISLENLLQAMGTNVYSVSTIWLSSPASYCKVRNSDLSVLTFL